MSDASASKHEAVSRAQPLSIVVVERDPALGQAIAERLQADGYRAVHAHTAQHARVLAAGEPPALAILGCVDPSPRATLELLAEIRDDSTAGEHDACDVWPARLPVIVLGASARPADLLRALDAGADDFLPRSCPPQQGGEQDRAERDRAELDYLELQARVRALLRRTARAAPGCSRSVRVGALQIEIASRLVTLNDRSVRLRPREYELLLHLAGEPRRVFTRHELLGAVWGFQAPAGARTLDSHACRLRQRLAERSTERWVVNVRGVGYRLLG